MKNSIKADIVMKYKNNDFTFARATRPHQEHPERNEDYILLDRHNGLAVICDGVGSAIGAGQAARVAAQTVKRSWQRILTEYTATTPPATSLNLEDKARQLLEEANQAVLALGKRLTKEQESDEKKSYAKTTIVLALFYPYHDGYHMAYAHIGDSRLYLLRKDAPLRPLTVDDGYFLMKMEKGEMNETDAQRIDQASSADQLSEEEREHFEKRNGITQSLGDEHIELHVDQIVLCPDDRILLCTDGIHDNLTSPEIAEVLAKHARTTVAKALVQHAVARSQQDKEVYIRAKNDDMSAIVVTCHFSSARSVDG